MCSPASTTAPNRRRDRRAPTARRDEPPPGARRPLTVDWAGWALFGLVATAALTVGHDRRPAGRPHPLGPAVAARHHRHRGPRPGPGRRVLHPPDDRPRRSPSATPPASPCSTEATWWLGGLFGLLHVAVALTLLVPLLAGVHPRIASDRAGPTSTAVLGAARAARSQLRPADPDRGHRRPPRVRHRPRRAADGALRWVDASPTLERSATSTAPRATDRGLRTPRRHAHRRAGRLGRCHRLDVRAPLRRRTGLRSPRRRAGRRHVPVGSGGRRDRHRPPLPSRHRQPRDHLAHRTGPPDAPRRDGRRGRGHAAADDPARSPAHRRGRPGRGRHRASILASASTTDGLACSTGATSSSAAGARPPSPCSCSAAAAGRARRTHDRHRHARPPPHDRPRRRRPRAARLRRRRTPHGRALEADEQRWRALV